VAGRWRPLENAVQGRRRNGAAPAAGIHALASLRVVVNRVASTSVVRHRSVDTSRRTFQGRNQSAARQVLHDMGSAASVCEVSPSSDARLSDTLDVLASGCAGDRISFDDLTSTLGDRCYAGLLFLLAAPNILPTPPGTSGILGVPLIILSAQLMLGLRRPSFPRFVLTREISTEMFAKVAGRLEPMTRRAERLLTRRLDPLTGLIGRRAIGLACLLLSVVLALPVPLGNVLPAIAITFFALALLKRDGLAVVAALAASLLSAIVVVGVGYGAVEGGEWLLGQFAT